MRFCFVGLLVLFCFFSCSDKNKLKIDVSTIDAHFTIKRFDIDFYNATSETLPLIKAEYPYLFPKGFTDSLALSKIKDTIELELFAETQKVYKNISPLKDNLTTLFKHIKYYNPKFKEPDVVTMLTNIDYESRVIYADSLLLISLDNYLGNNHKFYADFPNYIKENNTKNHLIVDVGDEIIKQQIRPSQKRRFIDKMIYEGKKMVLLDAYLPHVSEQEKMGYSREKYNWAKANEEEIWMYFIDRELLFSTETQLNKRFLENAPFSKFYMEQDNLSPGRIGVWLGWQIVKSYMKKNDVSLQELLQKDEEEIFKKSNYKPKK